MKTDRFDAKKQQRWRLKLKQRLSLSNIPRQLLLIANMNKHLQIPLSIFLKLDILNKMPREEAMKTIQSVPFLKYIKHSEYSKKECIRIEYENGGRMLLVTGIQREYVESMISQFNSMPKRYELFNSKPPLCKMVHSNNYWLAIQTTNEDAASALKKYLRSQKRNLDILGKPTDYKIEKRRIRIIIVKEDLFTILVDTMTEYKGEVFHQNFQVGTSTGLQRRKSQEKVVVQPGKIIYRPMIFNNMQNYNRMEKQEQFSDGFSESNSLNSDLFDPNKLKDIIETSDQGIQSENNSSTLPPDEPEDTPKQMHSSPLLEMNLPKTPEEIKKEEQEQKQHEKEVILKSQILRSDAEEFGVQEMERKLFMSPKKKRENSLEQEGICTEKISPIYNRYETVSELSLWPNVPLKPQSSCQTLEPLYCVIPDHMMRKFLQEFKSRSHSQLVQLPDWLKSVSQNQRNRHRFFSSLCKPKLIHRKQPL